MFADDTKMFRAIRYLRDCNLLQDDLDRLKNWSLAWLLKFHRDKCKVMSIGRKQTDFNHSMLQPSGQQVILERSAVERDLGILVDDQLSFSDHIHTVAQKANKIMAVIKRTFVYLDFNTFKFLFKAIVRLHL